MWNHYKRTFWRIQIPITLITIAVYFITHGNWRNAMLFWVVMQISALIGANWANRVSKLSTRQDASKMSSRRND